MQQVVSPKAIQTRLKQQKRDEAKAKREEIKAEVISVIDKLNKVFMEETREQYVIPALSMGSSKEVRSKVEKALKDNGYKVYIDENYFQDEYSDEDAIRLFKFEHRAAYMISP